MATRSRIGIENEDGTVSSIYCHWDGYPENNGKILIDHYTDRNKINDLISLGAISSLKENVHPVEILDDSNKGVRMLKEFRAVPKSSHTFENPQEGVVIAYHRDRGEDQDDARVNDSVEDYLNDDNEEYGYLFTKENVWVVSDHGRNFKSVIDVLNGVDDDDDDI